MAALFAYPAMARDESVVTDMHGTAVADPYRALENPDAPVTQSFVSAQNVVTDEYLSRCAERPAIAQRLKEGYNYPKAGCLSRRGSRYFRYRNTGLQNQYVLYMCEAASKRPDDWRVFLDPNTLAEDGTASLSSTAFSEDGSLFAYGVARGGSDWVTISVRSVESGVDLADRIAWVKFSSIAWAHDGAGFFYSRYPAPASLADNESAAGTEVEVLLDHALYYHAIGTEQSADLRVFADPSDRTHMVGAEVTDDGATLVISVSNSCEPVNKVYLVPVADARSAAAVASGLPTLVRLVDNFDAGFSYLLNDGPLFYFLTNADAPRYRVIATDTSAGPAAGLPGAWREVIAQGPDQQVLQSVVAVGHSRLVATWLVDVADYLKVYTLDGAELGVLPLPAVGQIMATSARREHTELFFSFQSFLYPGSVYRYDCSSSTVELFDEVSAPGLRADEFATKQVFYSSKDGTRVPMFIVAPRELPMDGTAPTLLYGYGGFNISIQPSYSSFRLAFVSGFRGVLAIANIRGGGEYGKQWNKGGSLGAKQNCFDDFCAAAEWLIAAKYTSPARLACMGGSNGGLLVAACANQRPELFGGVVGQVGVLDMLRFHLFSIGHAWCSDYGCADKADEFAWLIKYSPVHNVPRELPSGVQYPATLLLTSDHDDRVVPLHTLKMIATLQHVRGSQAGQTAPLLARVEVMAGHGAGKPTSKIIDEYADIYAFLSLALNAKFDDSKF